jgi:uncharacterized alkaline shock family protein YloU
MDDNELYIAGIGVSRPVLQQIVSRAAERVEGVACVGSNNITSSLINVFTRTETPQEGSVTCEVVDDKLVVTVHVSVFFGYTFLSLAEQIRNEVARAISEQVGCDAGAVNVCIDGLVFPKE